MNLFLLLRFFILFMLFPFISVTKEIDYCHPETWKNNAQILEQLETGNIKKIIPMQEYLASKNKLAQFTSSVFFVELEDNVQAVFKPDDQGDSYFEEVAYKLSCHLGFPYIPPTVIRTINNISGSLQLFVNAYTKESCNDLSTKVDENDLNNLKIFYFIFGQWDTSYDNLLFWKDEINNKIYPIAIDNNMIKAIQKVIYGQRPYVAWKYSKKINSKNFDISFPFDQEITINDTSKENIEKIFGPIMPIGFIEYFPYHLKKYKYILHQNYLWRQFHVFSDNSFIPFARTCSKATLETLKKLNVDALKFLYTKAIPHIFKGGIYAKEDKTLIQEYFTDILDRRDQVIKYLNNENQNNATI